MKPKKKKFKPKGLTLIELLIVIAIGTVIILTLLALYTAGQRYFISGSTRTGVLRDGRHVIEWISRDIKAAIQVVQSWDVYTTSSNSLVLQLPSVDVSGLIVDVESDFDYVVYRLNPQLSHRLERIIDAKEGVSSRVDGSRVLADKVNSLSLSSGGVDLSSVADFSAVASIDIALTTRQMRLGRSFEETLNTALKLRNKSE